MKSEAWRASPVLGVRQVRQAAEYYRDVLGFRLDPVERDVYVYGDEVDSLHADLQRRGAKVQSAPQMAPHGIREMEVEDLNGCRLAFGEPGR